MEIFLLPAKGKLDLAIKTWSNYGKEAVDYDEWLKSLIRSRNSTVILKPGNTTTIFEQKAGGRIAGIRLKDIPAGRGKGSFYLYRIYLEKI